MTFEMKHLFFKTLPPKLFTDVHLPSWLEHKHFRWWFNDYVLKLKVGEHVCSDFNRITRIK